MKKYFIVFFLVLSIVSSQSSQATSYSWTGSAGTTDWQTNNNWTPNTGYPVNGDNVTIVKSGSPITISIPSTITALVNLTTSNITLTFNSNISLTGTVSFTSTTCSPTGTLSISTSSTTAITSSTFNVNLTIASTNTTGSALSVSSTTFNGQFTMSANYFTLVSNAFKSTTTISKTGSLHMNNAALCHDNTFDGTTNVTHEGAGALYFPNDNDVFNGVTTFEQKTGAAFWYLCNTSGTGSAVYFKNNCEFINNSTDQFTFTNQATNTVNFSAPSGLDSIEVKFTHNSSGYYYIGNLGSINFIKAKVHVYSTYVPSPSLPYQGNMQFGYGLASPTANKIIFDPKSNLYTSGLTGGAFSMTSTIFQGQYTSGITEVPDTLRFVGTFTQLSWGPYNVFDRHVKIKVPNLTGLAGNFNGATVIIQSSKDATLGGSGYGLLNFYNDVTFIHNYPSNNGSWYLFGHLTTNQVYATFNNPPSGGRSVVKIRSESASIMAFGYLYGILSLNDIDFVIERTVAGNFYIGYLMDVQFKSTSTLKIVQDVNVTTTFGNQGLVTFENIAIDGTEIKKGNIILDKVLFKENTTIEAIVGAANSCNFMFTANSVFNKSFSLKAPNFSLSGGLFKGNTTFYKYQTTGTIDQLVNGTVIFESDFTMNNGSSKFFIIGSNSTDNYTFKGNVTLKRLSTGEIRLARTGVCNFQGNIDYQGDFATTPYGDSGGKCVFNGTTDQTLSHNSGSSYPFILTKLEVNKASGKLILANPIKVIKNGSTTGVLTLTKGNIATSATGLLTLADDVTIAGGGKHSYVDGPLKKEGNESPFKFFIGKGTNYFPVSMTLTSPSTSSTAASFTAEFFSQNIPVSSSMTGTLKDLLKCQYWAIDKTGSPNTTKIQLSWNNATGQDCDAVDASVVTVARFNSPNWVNEGANNLVSSPGDSGTVESNALSSFGYFALGATVANTITPNDSYALLKKTLDGSYYSTVDGKLFFRFEEEYALSSGTDLSYKIYDETHTVIVPSTSTVQYGDNRYAYSTTGLSTGKYYILEVVNSKKEKWVLRFRI